MKTIMTLPLEEAVEAAERLEALSVGVNYYIRMKYEGRIDKLEKENKELRESENSSFQQLTSTITEGSKKEEEELDLKTQLDVSRSEISTFEERVNTLNQKLEDAANQSAVYEASWKSSCAEKDKLQELLTSKVNALTQANKEILQAKEEIRLKEISLESEKLKTSSLAKELEENKERSARKDERSVEVCKKVHDAFILDEESQKLYGEFFFDVHVHGQRVGAAKQAQALPNGGAPLDEARVLSIEDQAGVPIFDKEVPLFSDEFGAFLENYLKHPDVQARFSSRDEQTTPSTS